VTSIRAFVLATLSSAALNATAADANTFHLEEATIASTQKAILAKEITAEQLTRLYFARIKAYNGRCVKEPNGILGTVTTIPNAGQINALSTLNLRPKNRKALGFDERKARSMTDAQDADPAMPDALEVAAQLDEAFAKTGKLVGPLHGIVISIKDQYDTFDMRTTSGGDAAYANDRPPDDSTFVKRLRDAGAIIIAKANMGEYASGDRSAFGGTFCNPYDTERTPGRSSGGSGSSVAANLVMCSVGEESGPSVRNPAKNNNIVGLAPTQELVSRDGMIRASYMNDRVGPMCRTVDDAARLLDVIAGYDPKDELTAFAVGRKPAQSYASYAQAGSLQGVRIGVVREYMNKELFTVADAESIDIVERGITQLRELGATIVDPGPGGALFQDCVKKYAPATLGPLLTKQYPQVFAVDSAGKPTADYMPLLVSMSHDGSAFPDGPSIRGLAPDRTIGESRYALETYLRERGDKNISSLSDLVAKSKFFTDVREESGFSDKKKNLESRLKDQTLDLSSRLQQRFALQQIALQCMGQLQLDALTYPTSNIPAAKLGAPTEPTLNGRSSNAWTLLGANGFPAVTVPAGFTTQIYDRVKDSSAKEGTKLAAPIAAKLPVGIDFLARPFDEPTLFKIAAAYTAATKHRTSPIGFGPLKNEP
jgi:amidase